MNEQLNTINVAFGVGTKNARGEWLEVFFPMPKLELEISLVQNIGKEISWNQKNQTVDISAGQFKKIRSLLDGGQAVIKKKEALISILRHLENSLQPTVVVFTVRENEAQTVPEVYHKLQLISHRFYKPHQLNLTGIFGKLPNVAWTNQGAIDLQELPQRQLEAKTKGEQLIVNSVDKFPKMADYVVPSGIRIAATSRVRLGAYLGEGTTVMHEGFVNFNAGTIGPNMVEGRISSGVVVESGTDLGGGCSTMGTLSGGNQTVISVGKDCLIGANAGLGISLGDRCTIEAGLYVTAASKVRILDNHGQQVEIIKAAELSGKNDLLFRRNSQTGSIECLTNKSSIELNDELHVNN